MSSETKQVEPTPSLATSARIAADRIRHAAINWNHAPEWAQFYRTYVRFGSQSAYWHDTYPSDTYPSKRSDAPIYFALTDNEVPFTSGRPHPTDRMKFDQATVAVEEKSPTRLSGVITAAEENLILAIRRVIAEQVKA